MKIRGWMLVFALGLVFGLGCKKKAEEKKDEPSARPMPAEPEPEPTPEPPPEPPKPEFTPGALLAKVPVGELGVTVSHPDNVPFTIEGNKATFAAEGFYPVTLTVEPITMQNAVLKMTVNGEERPTTGSTWDGTNKVIQSDCLLVKCSVEHPNPYNGDIAAAGNAICDSVEVIPPPTEGSLRGVRDASFSWSGTCTDDDKAIGAKFSEAARVQAVQDAVTACWRPAASNQAWLTATPMFGITWRLKADADPTFETELAQLDGDTAALLECLNAAVEPLKTALPTDARTSADCSGAYLYITYDLDHKPVCPAP